METRVTITGIDIPFFQMVWLIIKWTLAAIPAMIIISIVMAIFGFVITLIFGGLLAAFLDAIPELVLGLLF